MPLRLIPLFLISALTLFAQEPSSTSALKIEQPHSLIEILDGFLEQVKIIDKKLTEEISEEERTELEEARKQLQIDFDELLAGKGSVAYYEQNDDPESFQQELIEIFDPLIGEIKNATLDSREKDQLRNKIHLLTQKKEAIQTAISRINTIQTSNPDKDNTLQLLLSEKNRAWQDRLERTNLELESYALQLADKEANSTNTLESVSHSITDFFRSRGAHLLIAFGVAFLTWFFIKAVHKFFTKVVPLRKKAKLQSTARTLDGAADLFAIILPILSVILTFFISDDWVLLSASLLIFVGLLWSFKDKLSNLAEEIRLILNIGSVREGELITFQGVSWQVKKIRIYTYLRNPELEGGDIRLPVHRIIGLHSRPSSEAERYFPTSTQDWVVLSDETFGKVLYQTPEYVELVKLGGSRKTIPTSEFLTLSPENLSRASFRIKTIFGIDYKHQELATSEIKEKFQYSIKKGLEEILESPENLQSLKVEFASASASSLDYAILADFKGSVAQKYNILRRYIQKLAVEACNDNNWEIPFQQITIHQTNPQDTITAVEKLQESSMEQI